MLAALLVWCAPARADDTHYQDFVVGGRAVGLGGAFTGIADDPSGLYYNPAGIVDVRGTSLQLSTSLYGFERGSIDDRVGLPVPGAENLRVEFTDLVIVPASAGFVRAFGPGGADGAPQHAYGVSVLVPSFRSFAVSTGDEVATYSRRVTDRELWSGAGYALRLRPGLSVGVSGYYILRTVVDLEQVTVSQDLAGGGQKFQTVDNDITFLTGTAVLMAGVKYRAGDRVTLGAALQSPSIHVHSRVTLRLAESASDPSAAGGAVSSFEQVTVASGRADNAYAAALRVGAVYQEPYKLTVSADVSLHGPVSYTLVRVPEQHQARLPFTPRIEREGVINFNAGVEYLIIRDVSVAAGVFTYFASSPSIGPTPASDQPPHVDLLGLTMALGYFGKHSLSRFGVVYSFGAGHDVIPTSDVDRVLGSPQEFRRVSYAQSFFYVFLSSTFRY
ncbi:MAG: hypothetical protein HYZ27_11970 [Deltaproteobacteria bacterium]|nr:hypothetical protein [Deltaproteobacteria bacterium]